MNDSTLLRSCAVVLAALLSAAAVAQSASCPAQGTCTESPTLDEYLHVPSGVRVYTLCVEEKALLSTVPSLFRPTGSSVPVGTGYTAGTPLRRFFFQGLAPSAVSRHFYTALDEEVAMLNAIPAQSSTFLRCDEGTRGTLVRPSGLSGAAAALDVTGASCPRLSRPLWRLLEQTPVSHHFTDRFSEYAGAAATTVKEGIRACVTDTAADVTIELGSVPPLAVGATADIPFSVVSSLATLGISSRAAGTFQLPTGVSFVSDSRSACSASGQVVSCAWGAFADTRGAPQTLRVRRGAAGQPTDTVRASVWLPVPAALTDAPAQFSLFDVSACTARRTPYLGCDVTGIATGIPATKAGFTASNIRLRGTQSYGGGVVAILFADLTPDAGAPPPPDPRVYVLARNNSAGAWQAVAEGSFALSSQAPLVSVAVQLPGASGQYALCLSRTVIASASVASTCAAGTTTSITTPADYSTDPNAGSVALEVLNAPTIIPDITRGVAYPSTEIAACSWTGNVPPKSPNCSVDTATNPLPTGLFWNCSLDAMPASSWSLIRCRIVGTVPVTAPAGQTTLVVVGTAANAPAPASANIRINVR